MNIVIIASGSRGDVQPYVALGNGFRLAGHHIRLVTHENYQGMVEEHNLEFWPIPGDISAIATSAKMQDRLEKGNFLSILRQMAKEAEQNAIHLTAAGLAASEGMDLILGGLGDLYTGLSIAEKLDLPFLQAYVVPFSSTSAFPSVLLPTPIPGLGRSINRLSHHFLRQMMWQGFRKADNRARQEVLFMPKASFWGPYNSHKANQLPILYGFSSSVIPQPEDWGTNAKVTGYWFLEGNQDWEPPRDLVEFLSAGSPPIYVGFGSMSVRTPEELTAILLNALEQANQRAILLSD